MKREKGRKTMKWKKSNKNCHVNKNRFGNYVRLTRSNSQKIYSPIFKLKTIH